MECLVAVVGALIISAVPPVTRVNYSFFILVSTVKKNLLGFDLRDTHG